MVGGLSAKSQLNAVVGKCVIRIIVPDHLGTCHMEKARETHLTNEFLRDHQRLIRLLHEVVMLLEKGDIRAACLVAETLDQYAGPHIEFEESILYPAAKVYQGDSFERRLLAEHHNARAGLKHLIAEDLTKFRKPEFQRKVIAALRDGLKHAENCSTLVNHLEHFSEQEEKQALAQLHHLKKAGRRWTELADDAFGVDWMDS